MSSVIERYDRDADRYGHHWAPVLDASARRLLERVAAEVRLPPAPAILDVGTGHGVLAVAALERWPSATVHATDAAAGMLREAAKVAAAAGLGEDPRLTFQRSPAEALDAPDTSLDLVVSSFVYQLVPDRAPCFAEAMRVLRPGGALAFVTWLEDEASYRPADEFDEAVLDLDLDEDEPEADEPWAGDFRSASSAARELRAAGFRRVAARPERLTWTWTPQAYLAYKRRYEEDRLFAGLSPEVGEALVARVRERWASLTDADWTWRAALVSALAFRPR